MQNSKLPRSLFKYRAFNVNTLRLLGEAEVCYAKPSGFNDPLDCCPTIQVDTDRTSLEKLCYKMLVAAYGEERALREIDNHRYMSTEHGDYKTDPEAGGYYMRRLASNVKDMLFSEVSGKGVLSLAERWNCPLMWSHYADEHRGLCIEYDLKENMCPNIRQVGYMQSGSIKISDLIAWKINGSSEAESTILNTFFFAKAPQWRYEREWRDIYETSGIRPAPFRISGIYFGLRCDPAVQTTIVKLFANANSPVKFYNVYRGENSFRLLRTKVDTDQIHKCGLLSSPILDFDVV